MKTDFILKGNICYKQRRWTDCGWPRQYVICVDGKSAGVFSGNPKEYHGLR